MKRRLCIVIVLLAIVSLTTFAAERPLFASRPEIKLGIILPLSGDVAPVGEECQIGLKILQNELANKITAFCYRFVIEDDQMAPKLTAAAVQKLLRTDKVDAILPSYSTGGNVAKPYAENAKVPMIAIGASDPTVANGSFCFTNAAKVDKQAVLYLETLAHLGYHRLAILSEVQQGANAIRDDIRKDADRFGIKIVSDEHFITGERDFRTLWLRIMEKKPDIILEQSLDPEFEIMLRQKKQLGYSIPVSTIEWFGCNNDLTPVNGSWQIGSAWSVYQTGFNKRVSAINPKIKNFLNAAYTYDSARIVINACEEWAKTHPVGKPTGKEIVQLIHQLAYTGALGKIDVDKQGVIDSDTGLWIVENGVLKPIRLEELKSKLGK